jgi:hypothetical protein
VPYRNVSYYTSVEANTNPPKVQYAHILDNATSKFMLGKEVFLGDAR